MKSVGEAIEQCVTSGDPKAAINTVLEDVCHNDDSSWRKRLSSPTRNAYYGNGNDSCSSPSTSSISYYGTVSSAASSRPQTLSSSTGFGQRAPLSAQTFVPPSTPFVDFAKPPLPRKYNEGNVCANGNQVPSMSNAFSVSANDLSRQFNQRPLSFSGDSDAPLEGLCIYLSVIPTSFQG